jgi:hypothetical protein
VLKWRESVTRWRKQYMTTSELLNRLERVRKRLERGRKWTERQRRRTPDEIPYRHRKQLENAAEFDRLCLIWKAEPYRIPAPRVAIRHLRSVPELSDSDYQIRMAEWRQHMRLNPKPTRRDPYNLPRKSGGCIVFTAR